METAKLRRPARGWRGYAFSRAIAGSMIPHRVQNMVIRTYAERHGLLFLLSVFEYHHEGSFMMLESVYESLPAIEGLIFYSVNMLPEDRAARQRLYKAVLGSGAGLRFALEEVQILKESDIALIEDIMAVKELSRQTVPAELIS
jgi:sporadic carbohydrate cluster protein (TIGR04323 family)